MAESSKKEESDQFSETAIRLLVDGTNKLDGLRRQGEEIITKYFKAESGIQSKYFAQWFCMKQREVDSLEPSLLSIIRKSSQWLKHGDIGAKHVKMELEARLRQLEAERSSVEDYFNATIQALGL